MGCASSKQQERELTRITSRSQRQTSARIGVEEENSARDEDNEVSPTKSITDRVIDEHVERERQELMMKNKRTQRTTLENPLLTSKATHSSSSLDSSATSHGRNQSKKISHNHPKYIGVPPPKSLILLRRNDQDQDHQKKENHLSKNGEDFELNMEIDRYIMMTLLERERDLVRTKADILRATSREISSRRQCSNETSMANGGNIVGKYHQQTNDERSLQDSLSTVFGSLFSGVDNNNKNNNVFNTNNSKNRSHGGGDDTTMTINTINTINTGINDLCEEILQNERLGHMQTASGGVLDSRFINGRRDSPGDWVEPATPRKSKRRTKKKKAKRGGGATADENNHSKSPSPTESPIAQEMKKNGDSHNHQNQHKNDKHSNNNAFSRSSSIISSRLSTSTSFKDKMLKKDDSNSSSEHEKPTKEETRMSPDTVVQAMIIPEE